ncbi:roadblock/LC7 domain-containing protein [Leptothrix ochracea]|uniref:roadblock/LC7 domain-containing protein n=1 Tax=Leptothrix ochracea TaxID=735331 RepID=UPI0034E1BF5D
MINSQAALTQDIPPLTVEIEASAIFSLDGQILLSSLPSHHREDEIGAMSAAVQSLGERTAHALLRGELEQILIKGQKGYVVMMATGQDEVFTLLCRGSCPVEHQLLW